MKAQKKRVVAVDLLRGITIAAMILVNTPGSWNFVYPPLRHKAWHGFTPTDLVFPLFIFVIGISISYAYRGKTLDKNTFRKIFIRSVKLFALGLILNAVASGKDFSTLRVMGVLQRISVVFFISSLLYLKCNWKMLLGIVIFLLLGYWLWTGFIPLHDIAPTFERLHNNWALYIDQNILGNHMWQSDYDPEGILSTIPCVASCLIGVLAGNILKTRNKNNVDVMIVMAIIGLVLGSLWHKIFPVNKSLWTSSFVLFTSGWTFSLLALCYWLTDLKKMRIGSIFIYLGNNAIAIYVFSSVITSLFYLIPVGDESLHGFLFQILQSLLGDATFASLFYGLIVTAFYILIGYVMYKKGLIIKI